MFREPHCLAPTETSRWRLIAIPSFAAWNTFGLGTTYGSRRSEAIALTRWIPRVWWPPLMFTCSKKPARPADAGNVLSVLLRRPGTQEVHCPGAPDPTLTPGWTMAARALCGLPRPLPVPLRG